MKTKTLILAAIWGGTLAAQAASTPFSWGGNSAGQLGDGTTTDSLTAVAVDTSGVLSEKTIVALSSCASASHTLAVASDGTVYGWGYNYNGELGDGTTANPYSPVAVSMTGALAGKTVVAVAAGYYHSLALTSDGLLFAWGKNSSGQLGNGSTTDSTTAVAVDMAGALSGKSVTAITCGGEFSAAATSDGLVFTWGSNSVGQLGNATNTNSTVPVAINTSGVLSGKVVTQISAGLAHMLACTSDGHVYSWGIGASGCLGNGASVSSNVPVAVDVTGVLASKSIIKVGCTANSSAALSSDGLIYTWGLYALGNGTVSGSDTPVAVDTSGVLSGKVVTHISGGSYHMLALTSDGELFSWGYNYFGMLGDGSTTERDSPVAVDSSGVLAGMAPSLISTGYYQSFILASPSTSTITATARHTYAANFGWLNWRTNPLATDAPVIEATMLHGKVYSSNVGWIDLGDGTPTGSGSQYTQTGGDIGVNHDGSGGLSGYAYGANIGWITFDPAIAAPPRVNLTTGAFSGYAYSANCGWIHLGSLTTRMNPGADTELLAVGGSGDGIADAWEQEQAQNAGITPNLANLGFSPNSDYDGDGVSDYLEYLADSNPYSAGSQLKITDFTHNPSTGEIDLGWNSSARRIYKVFCSSDLLTWTQVGATQTGGTSSLQLTGPAAPHLFFRVETLLPLSQ
ncbi:MAG: hypothetical protein IPK32_15415 [Verrucomicrobiaceae bacterium]|nr:hypothetical protein [Verrucomicrobiaceae bacterium]